MKGNILTEQQGKVLGPIWEHIKQRGIPLSRAELAKELGFATASGVDGHLDAVARKGWSEMHRRVGRRIRLLREGALLFDAEELGEMRAGSLVVAEECSRSLRLDNYDSVTARFEAKPDLYTKERVDIIAEQCECEPVNREVVFARLGNEVTLKRFCYRDAGTIELQPESGNPEHKPICIGPDAEDFRLAGAVVGAIIESRRAEDSHDTAQAASAGEG